MVWARDGPQLQLMRARLQSASWHLVVLEPVSTSAVPQGSVPHHVGTTMHERSQCRSSAADHAACRDASC